MKRNYRKKCSGSACFGRKYAVLYNYCWLSLLWLLLRRKTETQLSFSCHYVSIGIQTRR